MGRRGRRPGPDINKIGIIIRVLYENPQGLWIREIARRTGLNPMTVSNYANTVLRPFVDDVSLGEEKPILRVLRLKEWVFRKISNGSSIAELVRFSKILKKIGIKE